MSLFLSSLGDVSFEDDEGFLTLDFSFSPLTGCSLGFSSSFVSFSGVESSPGFSFGILLLITRLEGEELLLGILDFLLSSFWSEESRDLLLSSFLSGKSREVEGLGD